MFTNVTMQFKCQNIEIRVKILIKCGLPLRLNLYTTVYTSVLQSIGLHNNLTR